MVCVKHIFDIEIAQEYGVITAVILEHMSYWEVKHRGNKENFHDGRYWIYNSIAAWELIFPYLTKDKIRYALDKMEKDGLLLSGNYNQTGYDRTKWYALTDRAMALLKIPNSIWENSQMDLAKKPNGFGDNPKPIPIYTNKDTLNKKENIKRKIPYAEIIGYLNEKTGSRYSYKSEATQRHISARFSDGFTLEDFKKVIDVKVTEWTGTEYAKFLRPETLFGVKFENYLNQPVKRSRVVAEEDNDLPF